jgi:hypothetical protein
MFIMRIDGIELRIGLRFHLALSLRRYYPDQVIGVDDTKVALSAGIPSSPGPFTDFYG